MIQVNDGKLLLNAPLSNMMFFCRAPEQNLVILTFSVGWSVKNRYPPAAVKKHVAPWIMLLALILLLITFY